MKTFTPTHYTVVSYDQDGKVTRIIGGTCSLKGDVFEEMPLFGNLNSLPALKGKLRTFRWKVDENQLKSSGALTSGETLDEVWERAGQR